MRTVVFPALRLLIWAVIAAALALLAFRGGTPESASAGGPGAPTVDLTTPTVAVARGAVVNTVTVQGTVVADPAVVVKATAAGTVRRVLVKAGDTVSSGQALLEIRSEEARDPVPGTDADGNPTQTPRPPLVKTTTVAAPGAGTVTAVDVLVDQVVAVGDRVGAVSPGTLSVTAPLTQAQQFRLLSPPSTAQVSVQGGPAPFPCGGLTLGTADTGAAPEVPTADPSGTGATGPAAGSTTRCAVPPGMTVFAGMAASVAIEAGRADDVLVVPITAVQGAVQTGTVWVVGDDGTPTQRQVTLGLSDGDQIEVRDGLIEGESVLQFVPVPDDTPAQNPAAGGPTG
jgi:multidrug efflux pump subunit AcrA (membrane-fusion protein)